MIFITVGTHEQSMDRLLSHIDTLIEEKKITDEVFAQIGYTSYIPKNYGYKSMLGYDEMNSYMKRSDIIITHGGPGSIFLAIQYHKVPIVVPRNPEFNEHVDDHQILFTKKLEDNKKVIAVYDIGDLNNKIEKFSELSSKCQVGITKKNNFTIKFEDLIEELIKKNK